MCIYMALKRQLLIIYILLKDDVPFVTAHLGIFHCTHHPVIPKSDLYFTFCSTLTLRFPILVIRYA